MLPLSESERVWFDPTLTHKTGYIALKEAPLIITPRYNKLFSEVILGQWEFVARSEATSRNWYLELDQSAEALKEDVVTSLDFWEQPEQVAQFAGRDPDHRLVELLKQYPAPSAVPVLDLGCAGGRNTELLVRGGFDTMAADASRAMVEVTRRRVAPLLSPSEAEQRVLLARMDDLRFASDASFDLVVALGIYQVAETEEEWRSALRETARVLRIGGRCLVANFAPGTGSRATPPRRVPGSDFVYDGFRYGRSCLLTPADLDREFRRFGFSPEVGTESVDKGTPEHGRITVNALYRLLDHAGRRR